MADIRINALATTAASTASDDFVAVDGSANGTRKLNAYSPTFGGNLTVSGTGQQTFLGRISSSHSTAGSSSSAFVNTASNGYGLLAQGGSTLASTQYVFRAANYLNADAFVVYSDSATLSGNLTVSGGTITGGTSGLSLAAGGTNQNITLTPSGTGVTVFNRAASAGNAFQWTNGTVSGSIYLQSTGTPAGAALGTTSNHPLYFFTNSSAAQAVLATTGNFLIGGTTDGGNGKLQLADHSTSAGGIGFGTVTSLYASSVSGCLELAAASGTTGGFKLYNTTNQRGQFVYLGTDVYIDASTLTGQLIFRTNGSTTALTLDSSQNATFAGNITVDKATPAILVKRGANTQNGQIQFATGASGDFAIGNRGTSDSDLHIYNYGLSADSITISKNTSAVTFAGSIAIGNTVNTVSPTSPNRTITMVIGGTTYYIHAKTTND